MASSHLELPDALDRSGVLRRGNPRILLPVPLIGVLAYCAYGWTSPLDPMAEGEGLTSHFVYAVGVITSLLFLVLLLAGSIRADARHRP